MAESKHEFVGRVFLAPSSASSERELWVNYGKSLHEVEFPPWTAALEPAIKEKDYNELKIKLQEAVDKWIQKNRDPATKGTCKMQCIACMARIAFPLCILTCGILSCPLCCVIYCGAKEAINIVEAVGDEGPETKKCIAEMEKIVKKYSNHGKLRFENVPRALPAPKQEEMGIDQDGKPLFMANSTEPQWPPHGWNLAGKVGAAVNWAAPAGGAPSDATPAPATFASAAEAANLRAAGLSTD